MDQSCRDNGLHVGGFNAWGLLFAKFGDRSQIGSGAIAAVEVDSPHLCARRSLAVVRGYPKSLKELFIMMTAVAILFGIARLEVLPPIVSRNTDLIIYCSPIAMAAVLSIRYR